MIVKQRLIFILYSLCASVLKGERRMLLTGVVCRELVAALSAKIICDRVTREFQC